MGNGDDCESSLAVGVASDSDMQGVRIRLHKRRPWRGLRHAGPFWLKELRLEPQVGPFDFTEHAH